MISRFRILFQATLLHDYFAEGKCESFDIRPSHATVILLADARLSFKVVGNKLLVLTKVDEAGKPAADLPAEGKLAFYLDLKGTEFLTVTNIDAAALSTRRLYFTNLNQNLAGSAPSEVFNLSRAVEAFDAARTYRPGEKARLGSTVHECIKTGLNQVPNAANSAFWVSRGAAQYVTSQDLIAFQPRLANFTLQTAAHSFRVRIFGLNPATQVHDVLLREDVIAGSPLEAAKDVQVNLEPLKPGRYRLDINGEIFETYFDDKAVAQGAFGVVEVFFHLPAANPFSLLLPTGVARQTAFTIRFANRRAFWKYVTPLHKVQNILLNGAHEQPSPFTPGSNDPAQPAVKDFFLSNRPLPLSEVPAQNQFDLVIGSEFRPAPKPDPRIPGILTQAFDDATQVYLDSFCTIRLNH